MMNDNREEYINYRLKRAEEAYEEAILLNENQRGNVVINRLYITIKHDLRGLSGRHEYQRPRQYGY